MMKLGMIIFEIEYLVWKYGLNGISFRLL